MIFTVSPHAMFGFKVSEDSLSCEKVYHIRTIDGALSTFKKMNKCHEFINKKINDWIIANGLNIYEKGQPPKFSIRLNKDQILIGERIR